MSGAGVVAGVVGAEAVVGGVAATAAAGALAGGCDDIGAVEGEAGSVAGDGRGVAVGGGTTG